MNELSRLAQIEAHCLNLLSLREHSQQELLQKLTAKGFEIDLIQEVIDKLAIQNWQSDARYAEIYARSRFNNGFGKIKIAYELKQHGIKINDYQLPFTDSDEFLMLCRIYQKKYPTDKRLNQSEWAKRSRFLLQRGFSPSLIKKLFKHLDLRFN